MMNSLIKFLKDENGASLAEYGLLVALIAVAAMTMVGNLGTNVAAKFTAIANKLT